MKYKPIIIIFNGDISITLSINISLQFCIAHPILFSLAPTAVVSALGCYYQPLLPEEGNVNEFSPATWLWQSSSQTEHTLRLLGFSPKPRSLKS